MSPEINWDEWMKKNRIYIPTVDEMEKCRESNYRKMDAMSRTVSAMEEAFNELKTRVKNMTNNEERYCSSRVRAYD